MEPLDLSATKPRSPSIELAGLAFTGRVVDKLRAALPGGNPNGFFPFTGFSEIWQHYSRVKLAELFEVVRDASDESEVVRWLEERTAGIDKASVNAKLRAMTTDRVSPEWKETFETIYPLELREKHRTFFELLDADDARLYGG